MMKSYFTGIKPLLINQIQQAQHSIQIAVAWFTDSDVLEILLSKRKAGVSVKVLISNDSKNFNESYSLDFTPFQQIGGKLMVVEESFMHHKFCIIDQTVLLAGSANYTYNGFYKNKESIFIIHEQETIAEFERLAGQIQEENGVMVSPVIQSLHSQIKFYNHQISWLELELAEVQKHIELYEATYRLRFQREWSLCPGHHARFRPVPIDSESKSRRRVLPGFHSSNTTEWQPRLTGAPESRSRPVLAI